MKESPSKRIVRTALLSALLVLGKLSLSFIPNIEIVTACVIIFSFVFGFEALFATLIFCALDNIIYSFSLDVTLSYFTYWPALSLVSMLIKKTGGKNAYVYAILGVLGSLVFGIITSAYYSVLFSVPFLAHFLAGIPFYCLQMLSALVFLLAGFTPLVKLLEKIGGSV